MYFYWVCQKGLGNDHIVFYMYFTQCHTFIGMWVVQYGWNKCLSSRLNILLPIIHLSTSEHRKPSNFKRCFYSDFCNRSVIMLLHHSLHFFCHFCLSSSPWALFKHCGLSSIVQVIRGMANFFVLVKHDMALLLKQHGNWAWYWQRNCF